MSLVSSWASSRLSEPSSTGSKTERIPHASMFMDFAFQTTMTKPSSLNSRRCDKIAKTSWRSQHFAHKSQRKSSDRLRSKWVCLKSFASPERWRKIGKIEEVYHHGLRLPTDDDQAKQFEHKTMQRNCEDCVGKPIFSHHRQRKPSDRLRSKWVCLKSPASPKRWRKID